MKPILFLFGFYFSIVLLILFFDSRIKSSIALKKRQSLKYKFMFLN